MSQGLEQYQDLIEQLKPVVKEPAFNQILSQVAASVPKPKRFLLKMELKRQSKPTQRMIDLRGMVDGKCQPYEHEGITHFLDDVAIEVFERQVRSFGGYTIGVYEAVTNTENNFRVMHQKQRDKQAIEQTLPDLPPEKQYQTPIINFSGVNQRREERMNFVVPVEAFTELNESIHATSVDISISGLKLKVNKRHLLKPGDKLKIHFRGLETEYGLHRGESVNYLVTDVDRSREEQRVCLKRLYDKEQQAFDEFLERFIQGNKRRYKVNMDNTIEAIMVKGYEQYYIPHITSVPVFIENNDDKLTPRYLISNDCNKDSIQFWNDETGGLRMGYLFTRQRLQRLLEKPQGEQSTYLYVFTHTTEGRVYFYSATLEELEAHPEVKDAYLAYGSRKASWRVYKLQLTDMHPEQCHTPLSLPDTVNDQIRRMNMPPSARLMSKLKTLTHIALITDISNEWNTRAYQRRKLAKGQLSGLQVFCHPRNRHPAEITPYRFRYQELRRETRFMLRSPVTLSFEELRLNGVTEDLSPSGLKVEMQNPFPLAMGEELQLLFPKLQKQMHKYGLTKISYEVVRISDDAKVIHLKLAEQEETARKFFDDLIRSNRRKLRSKGEDRDMAGIGEALRNIYAANIPNIAMFIRKDGIELTPQSVTSPNSHHPLYGLFTHLAEQHKLNLYPLYGVIVEGKGFIEQAVKHLRTHNKPASFELFIAFDPAAQEIHQAFQVRVAQQFRDDSQRRQFIRNAQHQGRFLALRLFVTRTGRPDISLLNAELNYVGTYAVHKAKMLEEQLWAIAAVADIIDVTAESIYRYGLALPSGTTPAKNGQQAKTQQAPQTATSD
ncbi:PilZ domain-containing protein [Lacimicrobium alkaliphilum]|uniref:PilZ domain-containing protein n=1 Tax=Lacimicrobium alkaliphilum TaxID=1526571 RepID=A0A0U3AXT5_9ALTE|nr:PilZ domain-containing protein [Lacimicrobium alkaliphilum]ALS97696.1 hypothetical protein AT746_05025 [Lacimicrobium alkaliphilum]